MSFEPQHDKTKKIICASSKDSDQLGHLVSLIRVFAVCMKKPWVLSFLAKTDQTVWMCRLIWVFTGSFCWFCRAVDHMQKLGRTSATDLDSREALFVQTSKNNSKMPWRALKTDLLLYYISRTNMFTFIDQVIYISCFITMFLGEFLSGQMEI